MSCPRCKNSQQGPYNPCLSDERCASPDKRYAPTVLAQSSNVPFVQCRNVPFGQPGGDAMPGETIEMTKRALHRLKVVEAVTEKRLTQTEAGSQLGMTARQVKRLVAAYLAEGAAGLVSRRLGRPWPRGSSWRCIRSKSRSRPCAGSRSSWGYGGPRGARPCGRFTCASGGAGSAN